jgi:hypothetical protein
MGGIRTDNYPPWFDTTAYRTRKTQTSNYVALEHQMKKIEKMSKAGT